MHPRQRNDVRPSEITPERVYRQRRELLKMLGIGSVGLVAGCGSENAPSAAIAEDSSTTEKPLTIAKKGEYTLPDPQTSFKDATHYNNYYEFGTDKSDPARTSGRFKPTPWSVEIAGHAEVTGKFTLEDILKPHALEERVYRHRCVEGWSMVIPWDGISLADLLKRFKPTAQAKYVAFTTVNRPSEMPACDRPCSTGHTARACASTKPCTRSPSSPPDCTGASCRTRTVRRCA